MKGTLQGYTEYGYNYCWVIILGSLHTSHTILLPLSQFKCCTPGTPFLIPSQYRFLFSHSAGWRRHACFERLEDQPIFLSYYCCVWPTSSDPPLFMRSTLDASPLGSLLRHNALHSGGTNLQASFCATLPKTPISEM